MIKLPYARHRLLINQELILTEKTTVTCPSTFWSKYGLTTSPKVTEKKVSTHGDSQVIDDWVVPDFKKRSALGEVFNNPFSKLHTTRRVTGGRYVTYSNVDAYVAKTEDNGYMFYNHFNSVAKPVITFSGEADADRNAQLTALGSVNATDFDALTFAGEWSKTKQLHRDVGNALLKVLLNPKRNVRTIKARVTRTPVYDDKGNPVLNRNGKPRYKYLHEPAKVLQQDSFLKDVGNAYLVGRYGVAPLLASLEDACKSLTRSRALRKTARGSYTVSATAVATSTVAAGGMASEVATVLRQRTVTKTKRYGLVYETSAFMSGAGSLGLTRPLSTIWELTPYSFVFDWFLNIGGWLDAIQPSGASKTLCAWVSTRSVDANTLTFSGSGVTDRSNQSSKDKWSWSANGQLLIVETFKDRSLWSPVTPTFPALGQGFNTLRSFDFAALVLQKLR